MSKEYVKFGILNEPCSDIIEKIFDFFAKDKEVEIKDGGKCDILIVDDITFYRTCEGALYGVEITREKLDKYIEEHNEDKGLIETCIDFREHIHELFEDIKEKIEDEFNFYKWMI